MVEFAIVANIVMISVLTCMEFARMNMVRNLVQDAAYAGARHAIVPGATASEAVAKASGIMQSLLTSGYTVDVGAIDADSESVSVTVRVELNEVALFTPLFLGNKVLESTATMRTERYSGFFRQ